MKTKFQTIELDFGDQLTIVFPGGKSLNLWPGNNAEQRRLDYTDTSGETTGYKLNEKLTEIPILAEEG